MLKIRNVIFVFLVCIAFILGVIFENSRLVEKADLTAAILVAKSGKDLIEHNKKIHSEYISLLQSNKYEELKAKMEKNFSNLTQMGRTAYNPCDEAECSKEQYQYLRGNKE